MCTDVALSLPSIDHITSHVKALGPGAQIYKIDISRAFRHVKIDPGDLDLLGLLWVDATYIDMCLVAPCTKVTCLGIEVDMP